MEIDHEIFSMVILSLPLIDWSWNIFYGHSIPSADLRRALSVSGEKNAHKYWLTA